ncbi:hypothetical protein PR202_ga15398 [Eleusine coracana subsp. coracana]|uniref:Uncharacterized protein n=1 Tax=Eleusine coracana subsp. coracana TaxID=191504 RepID=A0AAV5CK40_ELECO|nr:hypothetical protein PR202_ga15398 [Eleusine coracana subsp. coracana]
MASAPALLLPAVRLARPPPAPGAPAARPARVHLHLAARRRDRWSPCAAPTTPAATTLLQVPATSTARRCTRCGAPSSTLTDNFGHVLSAKSVVDVNDYNIGTPFGNPRPLLLMFKTDPWTFLDAALGYAFYKLSVLSSDVDRRGFVNDFITKIKIANVPY